MAAVRHLGFVKFEFLMVCAVKGHILHQRTKFHKDRSNRHGDIAIFVIFQDGGRRLSCEAIENIIVAHRQRRAESNGSLYTAG